jgi:hypothetical protein
MKKLLISAAVLSTLSFGVAAAETGPSYDFVKGSYTEFNTPGESPDGYSASFSKSLTGNVFFEGGISRVDDIKVYLDTPSTPYYPGTVEVNETQYFVGAGYAYEVLPMVDLVGSFGTGHIRYSGDIEGSLHGQYATAGVRAQVHPKVELGVTARRVWSDFNDTDYQASARFYLNDRVTLDLGYAYTDSDFDAYQFGLAYHF